MLTERNIRYAGWRMALRASVCIFAGFRLSAGLHFRRFPEASGGGVRLDAAGISTAFGIAALSVAACSPLLGRLLDRHAARRIILPCMAVFGCAFMSLSLLTRHLWHLYAVFLVLGVVGNGTAHLACSRVVSTWFHARRGAAFAVLMTGGALGAIVLPVVSERLIGAVGWRYAYAMMGRRYWRRACRRRLLYANSLPRRSLRRR